MEFVDGKMHGTMKVYFENGKLSMELSFENGEMHGPSKVYTEQGEKQVFSNYSKGKLHGDMVVFNNGKPYLKKVYDNGKEMSHQHDHEAAQPG